MVEMWGLKADGSVGVYVFQHRLGPWSYCSWRMFVSEE